MKKVVLSFGLIAGAILTVMMWITLPFLDVAADHGYVIGYTTMVVAFLLIYFGARSYRDNVAGGTVSFGRAFAVGASIALVASVCYVASWEVMYYNVMPDFMDKYQAHALEKARQGGETDAVIARKKADMDKFAKQYRNPAFNAAVTFLEPLPVGLIIALVSAGVLSRRRRNVIASGQLERSA